MRESHHLLGLMRLRAMSAIQRDFSPTEMSTLGVTGLLLFRIPRIGLGLMFQYSEIKYYRESVPYERRVVLCISDMGFSG